MSDVRNLRATLQVAIHYAGSDAGRAAVEELHAAFDEFERVQQHNSEPRYSVPVIREYAERLYYAVTEHPDRTERESALADVPIELATIAKELGE